jgi:hypothetical protein
MARFGFGQRFNRAPLFGLVAQNTDIASEYPSLRSSTDISTDAMEERAVCGPSRSGAIHTSAAGIDPGFNRSSSVRVNTLVTNPI